MTQLTCFKAYDIRGELGEELNEDIAYRIGRAYGEFLKPGKIVVGGDVRLTSESLKLALAPRLMDAGTDRAGYWPERHGRDLLRHFPPRGGRRHRGDGQP
ncbi:Phosphomannomutase dehydrogenase [Klebsiella pneumoniae subsp. ozaenae]|uniref:Phosphomannomutase n=1 Tax=Klebsiella pneumoniae subsp. ozaenae TaxID=574 RepID=A0A378A0C1_KLEPO|nr:Phosphomannomutase dehydrogenase [Klebsiella pneumoniae subsp. ozaenae]